MLSEYGKLFLLALATSSISLTISRAKVFRGAREWTVRKNPTVGKLLECPYCTSHWVAFLFTAIYLPAIVRVWVLIDWFVTSMAVVAIAAILQGLVFTAIGQITHEGE